MGVKLAGQDRCSGVPSLCSCLQLVHRNRLALSQVIQQQQAGGRGRSKQGGAAGGPLSGIYHPLPWLHCQDGLFLCECKI